MHADFWHRRWANNEIGFHLADVNPLLLEYWPQLKLAAGSRVLVPLCGKTLDIHWLLAAGFQVIGAELNESAVQQLFAELNLVANVDEIGALRRYHVGKLQVFVGDIFALDAATLGPVDAIYDRAALVALPAEMRSDYAAHLAAISQCAPQLLISFDYAQEQLAGPPFSVPASAVHALYDGHYHSQRLASVAVEGGLKGQCAADEQVWLLSKR
ncbi:thiopurine S-methyltransferase [Atopomonas hussainii]|uniref:Thiopurine S-methyltransferase n=1 Tax=Atopomonas hussainii TaxID=1429083 RepID=A0A1H7FBJ4_9GAMM|nr:thiopurine S-methyltransferase [Atopomonas hussainii]SEK21410.1 thiopurine S-methyltransferase [Atopomonas hussainii]